MNLKGQFLLVLILVSVGSIALSYIDLTVSPMTRQKLIDLLVQNKQVTELDQVPAILPRDFRMNFVLKHGIKRQGERGHLIEEKVSQSSDPLAPRVIIFDERTGFTVSYNGGTAGQTAGQRLDIMSFDDKAKAFKLEQIDFPIQAGKPRLTTTDCASCHGPNHRPIFAMYPDWPSFYGSDNDELSRPSGVQLAELTDYLRFREQVVPHAPRYSPLYSEKRVSDRLGIKMYPTFPFRQDGDEVATAISRAFAFRPGLRLGIVYNRQTAQAISKRVIEHSNYKTYGAYFLFNLFQCGWTSGNDAKREAWNTRVEATLGQKAILREGILDYRQLWALFGMRVNDVDIRYRYDHKGYENLDARGKVMEIGYIGHYFNSYFDGSATIDELIAASVFTNLTSKYPVLTGVATPRGLEAKYSKFVERFKFDKAFFRQMDAMGKWLPIPYPTEIASLQHRERFTHELNQQHVNLCRVLEKGL